MWYNIIRKREEKNKKENPSKERKLQNEKLLEIYYERRYLRNECRLDSQVRRVGEKHRGRVQGVHQEDGLQGLNNQAFLVMCVKPTRVRNCEQTMNKQLKL